MEDCSQPKPVDSTAATQAIVPGGRIAKGRRPWIAGLLALFVPPVAFAYVGRLGTGLLLVAAAPAVLAISGWTGMIQSVAGFAIACCAMILLVVTQVALAWSIARRHRVSYRPHRYNRWVVYVVLAVLFQMLKILVVEKRAELFGYATYRIATSSMADTLVRGDLVVVDARPRVLREIGRDDVVVYRGGNGEDFVRRVAGLPGETLIVGAGGVVVDGGPDRPGAFVSNRALSGDAASTITLGAGEYFVTGGDRATIDDRRLPGPIHAGAILGRARAIVYSSDLARIGPLH